MDDTLAPSRSSLLASPMKWVVVGVLGGAGVVGGAWAYFTRVPSQTPPLPAPMVIAPLVPVPPVPVPPLVAPSASVAQQPLARADMPAHEMMGEGAHSAPPTRISQATPGLALEDLRVIERPMIVSRSRIGPPLPDAGELAATAAPEGVGTPAPGITTMAMPLRPGTIPAPQQATTTPPAPSPITPPSSASPMGKRININTASSAEIELLPDIGPALAKRIIDHRVKHGAFKTLEDLDKVSGVGPKTLEKLKGRVVFADAPPGK